MLLVDTNVLVDILEDDPQWANWSIGQLDSQSKVHDLLINSVIYSELSLTFNTMEALDKTIKNMELVLEEMPRPALFLAGKAFIRYRRGGGRKNNVLADFFVGAHAAVLGCPILTRDPRRYRTYFPGVPLIFPDMTQPTTRSRT